MRRSLLLSLLAATVVQSAETPVRPAALSDFFNLGPALQDRNGDGVVDFVDARIALPESPTPIEIAAASTVAARLGFETTAMDLPVVRAAGAGAGQGARPPESGPTVFIGAGSLAGSGLAAEDVASAGGAALKAGDGLVASFSVRAKPAVLILGGDDDGLTRAALMFAGHLPHLWDEKSTTIDAVAADVKQFLAGKGIAQTTVVVPAVAVKAGTDGAARVVVDVQLTGGDLVKAQAALNQVKTAAPRDAKRALSYPHARELRIRLRTLTGRTAFVDVPRAVAPDAPSQPPGRRPGAAAKDGFDLSTFYAIEGGLGDSDSNLIPDRVDLLLSAEGDGTGGVVDLAARLGLESTGIALPIVKPAAGIADPAAEPQLVLIGVTHPVVDRLAEAHKWERPALAPGEGLIQVVKKAFGEKSALVVTGGDASGVARAVKQLAERFPYVWSRGKDRTTLDDVEEDVRRFLAGRTPAGQAAIGLYKLDKIMSTLEGKPIASARVRVFAEKAPDSLADVVRHAASTALEGAAVTVDVQNLDVQRGRTIIADEFDIPSEVEEFWTKLHTQVIQPGLRKHAGVTLEARLSEPPETRRFLEQRAKAELVKAGADEASTTVTILSAYKQGYSWLYDVVRPALAGRNPDAITIRFAELGPASGWKQQGMFVPTRWLLEIYPIDEILAAELGVDLKKITFEMAPAGAPAYEVVARDRAGVEILRRSFEPTIVERPFFDRFPDYEKVRVTTGWFKAEVGGRTVADERIATDPERFWDHFQAKTLPALYDHVMALGNGKPRAEDAPFFGELIVDLSMSEPDYRIPVDQEFISSMEAIHEELYFNTLHFFDVMGRFTRGAPLAYPGRVIPHMHPRADGRPGHAKITVTGFDAPRPSVVVEYVERDGRRGEARLDIPKAAVDRPQALAARVRAGMDGIARLDVRVKADTEKDEREALVKRAAEERVDRTVISAEQIQAVFGHLARLRAAGLYRDALSYHDLGALRLSIGWEHESQPGDLIATLDTDAAPAPFPDIRTYGAAGQPSVQWDAPIPPSEAYELLARMSRFKEATVYKVGESYLGKDVWAMDLMPPVDATHWSQAKQTTMKPTVVYSARQHANEVSSTSHVLKLAELLLTDPAYREKLNEVNVVIHPITNPDGAQLAYDLQKENPHYMLHAGYLGSLGVDVTAAQWETDPIYPESGIRPKIWRTWLPDIFLNPHGYPSHEWVQLFSEYAAWVRNRSVETRDYWTMRGWWMPGFAWLDDAKYPRHKAEQMKLLGTITRFAKAEPGTVSLNERAYARYKRYSFDFDQKNFKLDFTDGVLIYKSIKGARADPRATDFMSRNPNVTIWEGSTEAPDETARGDWMKLVATAGLQWDKAVLEYLVQGKHAIERKVEPFYDGVSLGVSRPRPPKPEKKDGETRPTSEAVR